MHSSPCLRREFLKLAAGGVLAGGCAGPLRAVSDKLRRRMVLLEAEGFGDTGGWVVDAQHMDLMGSPYLLAHGLGVPCAEATTTARFPAAGEYRVWVRTRDWAAPDGPGRFRVVVDGRALDPVFGAEQSHWHWQRGGTVRVPAGAVRVALRDLTGFDARCDAILFAPAELAGFAPPEERTALDAFRRELLGLPEAPQDAGEFDLVVAGGGFAGAAAAVVAARHGLRVALLQDRPVIGGNASSEIRVNPIHSLGSAPFRRNADVVAELVYAEKGWAYTNLRPADAQRRRVVEEQKNVTLFLETRLVAVETRGGRIDAVIAQEVRTGRRLRLRGALFADCTGDATLGALAGAEFRIGRESRAETGEEFAPDAPDRLLMGNSQYWYAADEERESGFPACPWALPILSHAHFEVPKPKWPQPARKGVAYVAGWNWETGFAMDNLAEAEFVRDHAMRAVYGTWDFLKNRSPEKGRYEKARLAWLAHVAGKRESRRLEGDFLLKQQHIVDRQIERDGCVTATWYFDIHYPHPDNTYYFPGREFRSIAYDDPQWDLYAGDVRGRYLTIEPYPIPYRCLYSRNVDNLFMAGRNLSVTHIALAPVRTMLCTGQMGVVVGRAAYLCRKHDASPRSIYENRLEEFRQLLAEPERGGYRAKA